MPPRTTRLTVPAEGTPGRLDRVLADLLAGEESRSSVARLVREGRVRLNGRPARRVAAPVVPGDEITVERPEPEPADLAAEDLPIGIVWEDENLAVVDKPAGMITHPAGPRRTGTLVNALLFRVRDLSGVGGALRPGIVHRLDAGTTGLLVVAKHDEAHRRLAAALARREIKRTYEAFAWGRPMPDRFTVDAPVGRDPRDRKRMAVVEGGREARSHVTVTAPGRVASAIEVSLETGRTHQIRVHLAHRGHPLVGDATYGGRRGGLRRLPPPLRPTGERLLAAIDRPALHARRLELVHPFDGRDLVFESPPPADLERLRTILAASDRIR